VTRDPLVEFNLPRLSGGNAYSVTSQGDKRYNCFAWAAGDTSRLWWPVPYMGGTYWPPEAPRALTIASFISTFGLLGYTECESSEPEQGYEKVALYANATGKPMHAARQLPSGAWTSKLGGHVDIEHEALDGVECDEYGTVVAVLCRPLSPESKDHDTG
jgi:hypothetical protein